MWISSRKMVVWIKRKCHKNNFGYDFQNAQNVGLLKCITQFNNPLPFATLYWCWSDISDVFLCGGMWNSRSFWNLWAWETALLLSRSHSFILWNHCLNDKKTWCCSQDHDHDHDHKPFSKALNGSMSCPWQCVDREIFFSKISIVRFLLENNFGYDYCHATFGLLVNLICKWLFSWFVPNYCAQ